MRVDWAIVCMARGLTTYNAPLWDILESLMPGRSLGLVVVDSTGSAALRRRIERMEQGVYVHLSAPFDWSTYANVGASVLDSQHLCFLHDDVLVPADTRWLDALRVGLTRPEIGIAVPRVRGACNNVAQSYDGPVATPWFHVTEYISNCCMTMLTTTFREIDGFTRGMTGYDWWGVDIQLKMAKTGRIAALIPSAEVIHDGGRTSGGLGANLESLRKNMRVVARRHGLKVEYDARPTVARITLPAERSLCLLTDRMTPLLRERILTPEGFDEVAVVDESGTMEVWNALQACPVRWRYAPRLEARPEHQVVSLAGGAVVRFEDHRFEEPLPPVENRRIRVGHFYSVAEHIDEFHLGLARGFGVGDTMMMTPAVATFKMLYPNIKIIAHHSWAARELYQHNPYIDEVRLHQRDAEMPPETVDVANYTGMEGTMRIPYHAMGIEDRMVDGKRMVYRALPEEQAWACRFLRELGYEEGRWTVGVQLHGGWRAKQWGRLAAFTRKIVELGGCVVTFGTNPERIADLPLSPRILRADGKTTLRQAFALLSLLDAFVGYDSGLSFAAVAQCVPTIALYGPHDPEGYLADAEANNLVVFRKVTPALCRQERGHSCRETSSGENCPFRDGQPGADCLDAVTVAEVVRELKRFPRWEVPLEERIGDGTARVTKRS